MNCERCNQPIEAGQLFTEVRRWIDVTDARAILAYSDPANHLYVHTDCPTLP